MTYNLPNKNNFREFISRHSVYLMILPPLIISILFMMTPTLSVLLLSFNKGSTVAFDPTQLTIENYISIFTRPTTYIILRDTLGMSLLATLLTFIIAYPVAYYLAFKVENFRLQNVITFLLVIPYWVDWSIRSISWLSILGRDGLVNYLLMSLGLTKGPVAELLFTRWTLLIIWIQTNILFMLFPIYLALSRVNPELLDVAQSLGATPSKTFYHVTFKLSLPGVIVGSMFVFVSTIGDYVTPALWAGGLQMLGLTVQNYAWLFQWPFASAYGVLLLIVTLVIIYILLKVVNIKQVFYE